MSVSQTRNKVVPTQVNKDCPSLKARGKTLTEATESVIALAFPKMTLPNANDGSQKVTGHIYESITFKGKADIHLGNIGESKHGAERSQKHQYKKIEAKEGRVVCGDAYTDEYTDKLFREKK